MPQQTQDVIEVVGVPAPLCPLYRVIFYANSTEIYYEEDEPQTTLSSYLYNKIFEVDFDDETPLNRSSLIKLNCSRLNKYTFQEVIKNPLVHVDGTNNYIIMSVEKISD